MVKTWIILNCFSLLFFRYRTPFTLEQNRANTYICWFLLLRLIFRNEVNSILNNIKQSPIRLLILDLPPCMILFWDVIFPHIGRYPMVYDTCIPHYIIPANFFGTIPIIIMFFSRGKIATPYMMLFQSHLTLTVACSVSAEGFGVALFVSKMLLDCEHFQWIDGLVFIFVATEAFDILSYIDVSMICGKQFQRDGPAWLLDTQLHCIRRQQRRRQMGRCC